MKYAIKQPAINYIAWIIGFIIIYFVWGYYVNMMEIILIKGPVYKNSSLNKWVYYNYYIILIYILVVGTLSTMFIIREWHEFRRNEKLFKKGKVSQREFEKHESRAQLAIFLYIVQFILVIAYESIMLNYYNYMRGESILGIMINEMGYFLAFYGVIFIVGVATEANIQGLIPTNAMKVRN